MPNRSSNKHPRDINQCAVSVVDAATGQTEPISDAVQAELAGKDPAAVALGRKGGLKGGKARAEKLSPEQRSAIAREAAAARWADRDGTE